MQSIMRVRLSEDEVLAPDQIPGLLPRIKDRTVLVEGGTFEFLELPWNESTRENGEQFRIRLARPDGVVGYKDLPRGRRLYEMSAAELVKLAEAWEG